MKNAILGGLGLIAVAGGVFALVACSACNGSKTDGAGSASAPESASAAAVAPSATAVAVASATASAAPSADAPTASAATSAAVAPGSATPAPSASAAAGPKVFDCGAKGQKACPMQGWMKSVMANAVASNDGDKIASALSTVASKPPPGMGTWSSIASGGAAKAKAGDIDGAKASCKQCHDVYKESYKKNMRDRPF